MALELPGAILASALGGVYADGPDSGVAAHYGEPAREWRTLESGRAFVDLGIDVVTVSGPDRLRWLHSLASQHLETLAPGTSTEALILDPAGHVQFAFFVYDDGSTTWCLIDAGFGAGLVEFLDSMRFMMRVEVSRKGDVAAIGAFPGEAIGPEWGRARFVWRDPWPSVDEDSATYTAADGGQAPHPAEGWGRAIAVVDVEEAGALVADLNAAGYEPAGMLAWEASRIAAWRPRFATEVDARALPHELDWLRTAVHLRKGCYRGQETIAKIVNLGRPPRRLVELYIEAPEGMLPVPGDPVCVEGREVGAMTSVCRHPEDGPIALALVRRGVDPAAVLEIGGSCTGEGVIAAQTVIVDPSGKSSVSPAELPGAEFRRGGRIQQ